MFNQHLCLQMKKPIILLKCYVLNFWRHLLTITAFLDPNGQKRHPVHSSTCTLLVIGFTAFYLTNINEIFQCAKGFTLVLHLRTVVIHFCRTSRIRMVARGQGKYVYVYLVNIIGLEYSYYLNILNLTVMM